MNALSPEVTAGLKRRSARSSATRRCAAPSSPARKGFSAGGDLGLPRQRRGEGPRFLRRQPPSFPGRVPQHRAVAPALHRGGCERLCCRRRAGTAPCCDIVLAAERAQIGDGHLKFGVVPGGGSSAQAAAQGSGKCRAHAAADRQALSGVALARPGLVDEVYPDTQLQSARPKLARHIPQRSVRSASRRSRRSCSTISTGRWTMRWSADRGDGGLYRERGFSRGPDRLRGKAQAAIHGQVRRARHGDEEREPDRSRPVAAVRRADHRDPCSGSRSPSAAIVSPCRTRARALTYAQLDARHRPPVAGAGGERRDGRRPRRHPVGKFH